MLASATRQCPHPMAMSLAQAVLAFNRSGGQFLGSTIGAGWCTPILYVAIPCRRLGVGGLWKLKLGLRPNPRRAMRGLLVLGAAGGCVGCAGRLETSVGGQKRHVRPDNLPAGGCNSLPQHNLRHETYICLPRASQVVSRRQLTTTSRPRTPVLDLVSLGGMRL